MVCKNLDKKRVLFIDGVPDTSAVKINNVQEDRSFNIVTSGSSNVYANLGDTAFDKSFLLLDINPQQSVHLQGVDAVFNQISDADTHKITLSKVKDIRSHVSKTVKFFNLPIYIENTSRDNIHKALQGIHKVYVPKTVKFTPKSPKEVYQKIKDEKFILPVMFRQAGEHGGVSTIILNEIEKDSYFHSVALDGRDYYLTQYVDYKVNGVYKKIRLIVVDGEVFIRHVIFSDTWMVHGRDFMDANISYQKEEQDIVNSFVAKMKPNIKKQIGQIHKKIGLDYFGIDCFIDKNFNILIFEVNANMDVLKIKKHHSIDSIWNQAIIRIRDKISDMIVKRLEA